MNYLKRYIKLVRKAQERVLPDDVYREKHHVFPVSIFGQNEYLVELTFKEHVVAHHLLYKVYEKRYGDKNKKTIKMKCALLAMLNFRTDTRKKVSDKTIAKLVNKLYAAYSKKKRYIKPMLGKKHSKQTIEKMKKEKNHKKYDWKNKKTGEVILNKTPYELRKMYPKLTANNVSQIIKLRKNSSLGWQIIDKNGHSIYEKILEDKKKEQNRSRNLKKANWRNIITGEIHFNMTPWEFSQIENISPGNACALVNLTNRTFNNFEIVDNNGESIFKQKFGEPLIGGRFKKTPKFIWVNKYTDEIVFNKTTVELAEYIKGDKTVKASLCKLKNSYLKGSRARNRYGWIIVHEVNE